MMSTAAITNHLAFAWGPLTFGAPLLAWGALACAIPVIIHMVLRQRPRRQVLPTARFLMASTLASTRTQRLKHLLLMTCRMLAILLLIATLMKSGCTTGESALTSKWLAPSRTPVSAVICLDDSASMGYRYQGQTRIRRAADWARKILDDRTRLPQGSEVALITGSWSAKQTTWTKNLPKAARTLANIQSADHDKTVADILKIAYRLLNSAQLTRKEIYLFTDLTKQSWRDPPPKSKEKPQTIYVLDMGQEENLNVSLGLPEIPNRILPADTQVTCPIRLRTGNDPPEISLEIAIDGQTRRRQSIKQLQPNSIVQIELTLPATSKGTHALTIDLYPQDAASFDNRRYATIAVGDPPNIIVAGNNTHNQTANMIAAMIAPASLPQANRQFIARQIPINQLNQPQLQNALALFMVDNENIEQPLQPIISKYVNQGGTLIVIPGPNFSAKAFQYNPSLLPAPVRSIEKCPQPIRLAADDLNHPYLKPFNNPALDSINQRLIFKRLILGPPQPNATIVTAFDDGKPALVQADMGSGRVILLAFSPHRQWSQFGSQAAPMIVLIHTIMETLTVKESEKKLYQVGQLAVRKIPDCNNSTLYIQDTINNSSTPLTASNCRFTLPTINAGNYCLKPQPQAQSTLYNYSVNVPETESDPQRIDHQIAESAFPESSVLVADNPQKLANSQYNAKNGQILLVPLALALLGLIFAESLFANRFYGFRHNRPKQT
ncbi:MAG: vWA domain-containing protein [Planctomycetota bacterium]